MKKTAVFILSAMFLLPCFAGCASKYDAAECKTPLNRSCDADNYYYRPDDRVLNFNHIIKEGGLKFYYEDGLSGRKINHGVAAVKRVQEFCDVPQMVYLLEDTVTHVNSDGLWVNPTDNVELVGAVLLESAAESELPFGIFAGVSANLLGEDIEYSTYSESRLESRMKEVSYVTELQYPLYTNRETTKKERETAWNFAYILEDIMPVLNAVGAILPEYHFRVGDDYYPIQIETKYFHYYFNGKFRDRQLTKKEFSLKYTELKNFVQENEELTFQNCTIFGLTAFPQKIDVFASNWDFLNNSDGYSDYAKNAILIKSVYVFMHEVTHYVLYNSHIYGHIEEDICEYFANSSIYRQMYFYKMYKGTRAEDKLELEKKLLPPARKLYNAKFGKADISNFMIDDWLDCAAYSINKEFDTFYSYQQSTSFIKYLYEVYGLDFIIDLNDDLKLKNSDQTLEGLVAEWRNYLIEKYENKADNKFL